MQGLLKTTCSRLGIALFIFMLFWNFAAIVLSALFMWLFPNWYAGGWALLFINDLSLYGIGVPIFLLLVSRLPNFDISKKSPLALSFPQYFFILLLCISIMYGIAFLTELFFLLLEQIFNFSYTNSLDILVDGLDWPALLVLGVAIPSVGEELLFRRILYRKLAGYGEKVYILFSSLCFGLFHINPSQVFYAFLLGLILAVVYARTKRLWIPISLHFFLNTLGLLVIPKLMMISDAFAFVFPVFILLIFPISLIYLVFIHRKSSGIVKLKPLFMSSDVLKHSILTPCFANLGMLLYFSLVLLLLCLNLWAY